MSSYGRRSEKNRAIKETSLHHSYGHPRSFQRWFGKLKSHARDSTYTSLPHMKRNLDASDKHLRMFLTYERTHIVLQPDGK